MSETANEITAEQITREAIAARIDAVATQARTHAVWIMGVIDGENANILRSDTHVVEGEKMIHAYMITRIRGKATRAQGVSTAATKARAMRSQTIEHEFTFRIRGIRFFKHGGTSGPHSENDFKKEITLISNDLATRFDLGLDKTVEMREPLQIEAEGFNTYGKRQCHQADLSITVCLIQTINS